MSSLYTQEQEEQEKEKEEKDFLPTPEQEAFLKLVKEEDCSAILTARAGTGKTTVIVEALKDTQQKCLCLAFNSSIATTLKQRLANPNVQIATLNAFGYALLRKWRPFNVDADKLKRAILASGKEVSYYYLMKKAISYAKKFLYVPDSVSYFEKTIDSAQALHALKEKLEEEDIELPEDEIIYWLEQDISLSIDSRKIDFDDQIYLPCCLRETIIDFPTFDAVFVDEAQDLSISDIIMLKKIQAKRIFFIGDPAQAIYAFKGADANAFSYLESYIKELKGKHLKLTNSFRCSQTIAKLAATYVSDFKSMKKETGTTTTVKKLEELSNYNAVLCRNNAPLIALSKLLKEANIPYVLKANQISNKMLSLVKRYFGRSQENFLLTLRKRVEEATFENTKKSRQDMLDCFIAFFQSETFTDKYKLLNAIQIFFDETKQGVELSSVHRAKGLEWDNVCLLNYNLSATEAQEQNLSYVAITRAINKIGFYSNDSLKKRKRHSTGTEPETETETEI